MNNHGLHSLNPVGQKNLQGSLLYCAMHKTIFINNLYETFCACVL